MTNPLAPAALKSAVDRSGVKHVKPGDFDDAAGEDDLFHRSGMFKQAEMEAGSAELADQGRFGALERRHGSTARASSKSRPSATRVFRRCV